MSFQPFDVNDTAALKCMMINTAFEQGRESGYRERLDCPYAPADDILVRAWKSGWKSGWHTKHISAYIRGECVIPEI